MSTSFCVISEEGAPAGCSVWRRSSRPRYGRKNATCRWLRQPATYEAYTCSIHASTTNLQRSHPQDVGFSRSAVRLARGYPARLCAGFAECSAPTRIAPASPTGATWPEPTHPSDLRPVPPGPVAPANSRQSGRSGVRNPGFAPSFHAIVVPSAGFQRPGGRVGRPPSAADASDRVAGSRRAREVASGLAGFGTVPGWLRIIRSGREFSRLDGLGRRRS